MTRLRRRDKQASEADAWSLLGSACVLHLASTTPDGAPLLRALHGVLVDGAICFHGAPKGEKLDCVGRPAVVSAEQVLAELPSTFFDPVRACPATTLYRSAMAHGVLEEVAPLDERAAILEALMRRYQPQGGYKTITADDPLYTNALKGVRVLRLRPERLVGKAALLQAKPPELRRKVISKLWARGAAGDASAIQAIVDAAPLDRLPAPLETEGGLRFHVAPGPERVQACVDLVAGQYWNRGVPREAIAAAHLGSSAWVAVERDGRLIATARAMSDGGKLAYVADVAVAEGHRGQGVGEALMGLLTRHPALRPCLRAILHTVDAGPFYARLGFQEMADRQSWAAAIP